MPSRVIERTTARRVAASEAALPGRGPQASTGAAWPSPISKLAKAAAALININQARRTRSGLQRG